MCKKCVLAFSLFDENELLIWRSKFELFFQGGQIETDKYSDKIKNTDTVFIRYGNKSFEQLNLVRKFNNFIKFSLKENLILSSQCWEFYLFKIPRKGKFVNCVQRFLTYKRLICWETHQPTIFIIKIYSISLFSISHEFIGNRTVINGFISYKLIRAQSLNWLDTLSHELIRHISVFELSRDITVF